MKYFIRAMFVLQLLALTMALSPMFTELDKPLPYQAQTEIPVEQVANDSTEEWNEKVDTIYTDENNITIVKISRQ